MDLELLKVVAKAKVNLAHKAYLSGNYMIYPAVISGMGAYGVEAYPGAGHRFDYVIDAIHEKYDEENDAQVVKAFEEAIYKLLEIANSYSSLEKLERIISYMNKKEKKGETKIHLDMEEINTRLANLIDDKYDLFKNENPQLDSWIARTKQIFKEDYGIELNTRH